MNPSKTTWWTTKQVAANLKATEPTVRYLCRYGLLPYVTVHDRCWRFDPDEVMEAAEKLGLKITSDDADATPEAATAINA